MNIYKVLFCKDISVEQLSDIYGYDEDTIIDLLDKKMDMTVEEKQVLDELI